MGMASICVGRRKTGKTTLSKKWLKLRPKNMNVVIYDINQEYKEFYNEPFKDFRTFLASIVDLKNTYILIEEATIFFDTRSNFEEMKNLLVRARHTNNIIQLNFHSFKSIPKGIYNLLDYVTVLKTNDSEKDVKERFDNQNIISAWNEAIKSSNDYFYKTISLY